MDPVPGTNNQVDLNYNVTEMPSAQLSFGVGYGTDGFLVQAGFNQSNFMGTGSTLGLNFSNDSLYRNYTINYFNPYFHIYFKR